MGRMDGCGVETSKSLNRILVRDRTRDRGRIRPGIFFHSLCKQKSPPPASHLSKTAAKSAALPETPATQEHRPSTTIKTGQTSPATLIMLTSDGAASLAFPLTG